MLSLLRRSPVPLTLLVGAAIILIAELLLFHDVRGRGGAILGIDFTHPAELPFPATGLDYVARLVAINMTPLCWVAYLLLFDGLLTALGRARREPAISSLRARPNRFIVAWLTSIPVWCFFDWVNFTKMDAWRYWGMPAAFDQRVVGYFVAFAAISPGMFLAAQLAQHLGLAKLRSTGVQQATRGAVALVFVPMLLITLWIVLVQHRTGAGLLQVMGLNVTVLLPVPGILVMLFTRRLLAAAFVQGACFTAWAVVVPDPIANFGLWTGLVYLLDPLAAWLGGPSIIRDWQHGRWGRLVSLFLGGAVCGLLWEFWNYWALTKWTYRLPFLGWWEQWKYFEMPWVGFLGFLPFALECWVALNLIIALLDRVGLRVAEPLPDETTVM